MKLIIDIPDRIYNMVQNKTLNIIDSEIVEKSIRHGTPIPDNAINGDVIKAVFVNNVFEEAEYEDEEGVTWIDMISDNGMTFEMDWWNAPYKGGDGNDI